MIESFKRRIACAIFLLMVLPGAVWSRALWRRPVTGRDCIWISRRLPKRLASRLCRYFSQFWAQLTEDEALFFGVKSIFVHVFKAKVAVNTECRSMSLIREMAASERQWILSQPHFDHKLLPPIIAREMPHKITVHVTGGAKDVRDSLFHESGLAWDHIRFIRNKPGCLRKLVRLNEPHVLVFCSPDRPSQKNGKCDVIKFGIFAYARRTGAPLVSVRFELLDDGTIAIDLLNIQVGEDITKAVEQYIEHQKPGRVFVPVF